MVFITIMGVSMRVLDLFSGIGGFSLGLERAGMETVAFCEYDEKCRQVLKKHWPSTPIHKDITKLGTESITDDFDLICGGFPCQPFSTASHGVKTATDLWPDMCRLIWQAQPEYIIAENVSEKAIRQAEKDIYLVGAKWNVWTKRISAAECGADHQRNRWWLCAYPHNKGELHGAIDAKVAELPELCEGVWSGADYAGALRVPNGIPGRVDRLKQLGNAVVPQIPEIIGRAIMETA